MTTYLYRCTVHGEQIVNKSMADASRPEPCPQCATESLTQIGRPVAPAMQRVYTAPITDCVSFGRNMFYERTPEYRWRPKNEEQARQFRDLARAGGHVTQFGAGQTTGS